MITKIETPEIKNFINGEWRDTEGTEMIKNLNPANQDVISIHYNGTKEDVEEAIQAADHAFSSWRQLTAPQRSEYLIQIAEKIRERNDELAKVIVNEMGKTYPEALGEVNYAAGIIDFFAAEGRRLTDKIIPADLPNVKIETRREPLGACLIITPWNFPLSIPAWKIAPALVTGNTVVLKTSSETPLTANKFMEILKDVNLPEGVVNHVLCSGRIINDFTNHEKIKAVTFTGSNAIGERIYQNASQKMKRVQLEMGGKNPLIVMDDADVDEAATLAIKGAFGQTGQACTATGKVIVHKGIYESFKNKILDQAKQIKLGYGLDEGITMGPQVSKNEQSSTLELIQSAIDEGADLLWGGKVPEDRGLQKGFFVEPAILTNVTNSMRIGQEEVFGPVINIILVDSLDEAIDAANDTVYGLSAAICTKSISAMNRALDEIEAGLVKVNMPTPGTFYQAPFGGYKSSSTETYKELGTEGTDFFTKMKTRYIKI
ncbi:2,5-dioxopentanoate dehydrogenase [Scopulibacillus darangshiensis]|uniref:3-sulfolactaldehyde dehydrogenase n=1 Tax=Scopulibacillus darangshiensis TaxID=442528 RepID=A0A4R2NZP7_9BACL|nr:aldehyde dehydrogenase family protein [Scopulibacillus darangshiensis]TCP27813.1 2,5-dioxopentanoate dehydrogenase [Scopulibacillus darangshiensis]